ncbi:MAG: ornithine carbamoyltransferase [Deltaproteobacteria bacterium]|nr:ornithine carbamoyltransferase [Deltaproteobacteria bacterium]
MQMNLLKVSDLTKDEIDGLLKSAASLKERHKKGIPHQPLKGKVLGLIFEKSSTRTRVSFETAMAHLGGSSIFISQKDSQIGRGEPIKDTARVMSRYVDAVVLRTFGHGIIEDYAAHSCVPVINGLTDTHHPCQVLSDILTVVEKKGGYDGMNVCWIGDGNNMANSWIEAAGLLGFPLKLACPRGYAPDEKVLKRARAANPGIELVKTAGDAAKGADVLNTDVWASMGQESEQKARLKAFKGYQINSKIMKFAKKDAVVMHCLPAHRDEEITDSVLEGPSSVVWDQAENRLHIQKAVLEWLLADCAR